MSGGGGGGGAGGGRGQMYIIYPWDDMFKDSIFIVSCNANWWYFIYLKNKKNLFHQVH